MSQASCKARPKSRPAAHSRPQAAQQAHRLTATMPRAAVQHPPVCDERTARLGGEAL